MNSDKIIGKLMNLNLKIIRNYLGVSHFDDKMIENIFQQLEQT